MNITFYSLTKRENSTLQPSGAGTVYTCKLLAPCSLISPRIELAGVNSPVSYSYAYIPDFGRYYFVRDWTNNGAVWIGDLQVDVLASYKTEIGSSSQYVLRAAADINTDLRDQRYVSSMRAARYQTAGVLNFSGWDTASGIYVVHQVGLINSVMQADYMVLTKQDFYDLLQAVELDAKVGIISGHWYDKLVNAIWLPVSYSYLKDTLGWSEYTATVQPDPTGPQVSVTYLAAAHESVISGYATVGVGTGHEILLPTWYDSNRQWGLVAPFAEYSLAFFPWGVISLDSLAVASKGKLYLDIMIDIKTGGARLKIRAGSGSDPVLADLPTNMAVDVPLHAATINGGAIASGLLGIATAVVGAATENYAMFAGGVSAAIGSLGDINKGIAEIKGNTGTRISIDAAPTLIYTYYEPVDDNHAEYGYPLCKVKQINTLSGYIMCAEGDIALSCTESERAQVMSYLTGGFYYE